MSTTELEVIREAVLSAEHGFRFALKGSSDLSFEAEANFATQILTANSYALGIALDNKQSVIQAVSNVAAIGLTLNPALKLAYLVPRDKKICLDIGYLGLIELAVKSGAIRWAQCRLVHKTDVFVMNGVDREPTHQFNPMDGGRGDVVGGYVTAKTVDGDYLTHPMSAAEITGIRDRSESWKAWLKDHKRSPWQSDWQEMWRKTIVKQGSKYWPKTERLAEAVHYLNTAGGEGFAEKETVAPDLLSEIILDLGLKATAIDVMAHFRSHQHTLSHDVAAYSRFRRAVLDRLEALKQPPAAGAAA